MQTTEHCFIQMEFNQLQPKQLVLKQLNGVDKMDWSVGRVFLPNDACDVFPLLCQTNV